ncbi:MAG: nucleotidyltransferase domain-containing protein, partial [Hyphomicrobiales bacterium]|nr:nucleotidyltransferase domain-containing protein [Hyphomicrobiales bacterium]
MDRLEILAKLRDNAPALRSRGVKHAALFGSHARGDAQPDSDIDILIEIEPEAPILDFRVCRDHPVSGRPLPQSSRCSKPEHFEAARTTDGR